MWRKLHILGPFQSLLVASVSAAIIAAPLALQSALRHEAALLHDIFWLDSLDPYIMFSLVFLVIVPLLLGYYQLGLIGLILGFALGSRWLGLWRYSGSSASLVLDMTSEA